MTFEARCLLLLLVAGATPVLSDQILASDTPATFVPRV